MRNQLRGQTGKKATKGQHGVFDCNQGKQNRKKEPREAMHRKNRAIIATTEL